MFKGSENIDFDNTPRAVYGIVNTISGKWYVGSTKNVRSRIYGHYLSLRNGNHPNIQLQSDFNSVGLDAFEIRVLENIKSKDKYVLLNEEKKAILRMGNVYNTNIYQPKPKKIVGDIFKDFNYNIILSKDEIRKLKKFSKTREERVAICEYAGAHLSRLGYALNGRPFKAFLRNKMMEFINLPKTNA